MRVWGWCLLGQVVWNMVTFWGWREIEMQCSYVELRHTRVAYMHFLAAIFFYFHDAISCDSDNWPSWAPSQLLLRFTSDSLTGPFTVSMLWCTNAIIIGKWSRIWRGKLHSPTVNNVCSTSSCSSACWLDRAQDPKWTHLLLQQCHWGIVMDTPTTCFRLEQQRTNKLAWCKCACIYICWLLPSNQSFCRQIAVYQRGVHGPTK